MFTHQQIEEASADAPVTRTVAEINEAISTLTPSDLLRLEKYARWRMRIVPRSLGRTWEDLLGESIKATLSGERSWRQGISFFRHLHGTLRSISTSWRGHVRANVISDQLSNVAATHISIIDPERHLLALETLNQIRALFADDPPGLAVLNYLGEGYTAAEIQTTLNLSSTQFDTVKKRVRRKAAAWLVAQDKARPSNANCMPLRKRKAN